VTGSPDLDIARSVRPRPIAAVAAGLGLDDDALVVHGHDVAKLEPTAVRARPRGRLVLVTAITPTPAGEGKTTTTLGLGDALNRTGRRAACCLGEPSRGRRLHVGGRGHGGGRAQVIPTARLGLALSGDVRAIATAHNLLAGLVDNHLRWGNAFGIDPASVSWWRVDDVRDRARRRVPVDRGELAGPGRVPACQPAAASELMAVFGLARDLAELERRLAAMVVAHDRAGRPVTCGDLGAAGTLAAVLRDAFAPNLVQSLEHHPVFVHGAAVADVAPGGSSVVATRSASALADYVVTEAGFGADIGAEKFFDITCRHAGLTPNVVVLVATVRALARHGGGDGMGAAGDMAALERGLVNLDRHVANLQRFGVPVVVALNRFEHDTPRALALVLEHCRHRLGVAAELCESFARGGEGALQLAETVATLVDAGGVDFRRLYPDGVGLWAKLETLACTLYGAGGCEAPAAVHDQLTAFEDWGYAHLPVCVAKTPYSFSADPTRRGAPSGHVLPVRAVRLAAGAGFVVACCGERATMPGLASRLPAERWAPSRGGCVDGPL